MTQHPGWAPEHQRRREEQRRRARLRRRRQRIAGAVVSAVVFGVLIGWVAGTLGGAPSDRPSGAVSVDQRTTSDDNPSVTSAPTPTQTATDATKSTPTVGAGVRPANPPNVIVDPIPYSASRRAQMADYSLRHYGVRSSVLVPRTIVLHFTENESYSATRNVFAANTPAPGPGGSTAESPGTCAHYVVDQDGSIYEIVPPTLQCRHTIGLNRWAIGIELIQATHGNSSHWACQQILNRTAQVDAARDLVLMLQRRFTIKTRDVIGHGTANESPYFRDRAGWRNDHSDWGAQDVAEFRALL